MSAEIIVDQINFLADRVDRNVAYFTEFFAADVIMTGRDCCKSVFPSSFSIIISPELHYKGFSGLLHVHGEQTGYYGRFVVSFVSDSPDRISKNAGIRK